MPAPTSAPNHHKRILRIVVALALLGLITHGTYAGSGDEAHYLAVAHSIAFDGDLDLANNYGAGEPLIGGGGLAPEYHVHAGANGVMRPVHDVGLPMLFAPVVRIARPTAEWLSASLPEAFLRRVRVTPGVLYRHLLSAAMVMVAVWLAGMLFSAFVQLGASPRAAAATSALVMLSPPVLIFSILFFTELPAAALAFFVFRRTALTPPSGIVAWTLTGAAAGLLFLLHARNAGLVAALVVIGLVAAHRQRSAPHAAGFVAGAAALLVIRTLINHVFWGTWLTTPHAALGDLRGIGDTVSIAGVRLAGLLVDQEFGLLIYAPFLVLAALGLFVMRPRSIPRAVIFICGCYLAPVLWVVTNVHGWQGGWNPAGRFMLPLVPLVALALPAAFAAVPRAALIVLLALQIVLDGYLWQNPKQLWNDGDGVAAICSPTGLCRWLPAVRRLTRATCYGCYWCYVLERAACHCAACSYVRRADVPRARPC